MVAQPVNILKKKISYTFIFVVLGMEPRAWHKLGKHWATFSVLNGTIEISEFHMGYELYHNKAV
jgi:hypothetical protein